MEKYLARCKHGLIELKNKKVVCFANEKIVFRISLD